ncbi:MAG TPA: type II secretion system protein GspN [bacterium]|nr:type II secretion system protein GspN [bacterium]
MSRGLKILIYPPLFLVCFLVFLYWMFPYDVVKERVMGAIESGLGGGLEVGIKSFKPHWITGIDVSGLSIGPPGADKSQALILVNRLRARAGIFSLIVGSPSVSFDVEIGDGEISGSAKQSEEALSIDADLDDVDLANLKFIALRTGLNLVSRIDGTVSMRIDRQQPLRSTGRVSLYLVDLKIGQSELKVAGTEMPLPDLVLAKGRESELGIDIGKGTVTFEKFNLVGGDLGLDIKGKLFLSSKVENYRLNLNGSFSVSQKLAEAFPFLFIVEQQKQENGTYPLTITGRLEKPSIKVGTFTVPL